MLIIINLWKFIPLDGLKELAVTTKCCQEKKYPIVAIHKWPVFVANWKDLKPVYEYTLTDKE